MNNLNNCPWQYKRPLTDQSIRFDMFMQPMQFIWLGSFSPVSNKTIFQIGMNGWVKKRSEGMFVVQCTRRIISPYLNVNALAFQSNAYILRL